LAAGCVFDLDGAGVESGASWTWAVPVLDGAGGRTRGCGVRGWRVVVGGPRGLGGVAAAGLGRWAVGGAS
jgi:hypothetical protein